MQEFVYAIFLMGCGHNLDVCRAVPAPAETYASQARCEEAIEPATRAVTGFPTAIGKCVALDAAQASAAPQYRWYFARDGRLVVEPRTAAIEVAQR